MHQKIIKALQVEKSTIARLLNLAGAKGLEPSTRGFGDRHNYSIFVEVNLRFIKNTAKQMVFWQGIYCLTWLMKLLPKNFFVFQ